MKLNLITKKASIKEALERLNLLSGSVMTLFVADDDGRIIASLTDGDIRRAILNGLSLDDSVIEAANRNFRYISGQISSDSVEILRKFREKGFVHIPWLDEGGRIIEVINLSSTPNRLPISALLMAGGKGERLRPLTLDCPKPLLEIDGKAIIDYNIEALANCGVKDITVATRYLSHKIEEHFSKPVAGINVKCVKEDMALGTIGAASLLDYDPEGTTLVMNSDLLTSISFEEMYIHHSQTQAQITIAVVPYQVAVPFAILSVEGDNVEGLQEKPTFSYYANAGIYMIDNKVLSSIPKNVKIDAPELIEQVIDKQEKVTYYPIKGIWIDIGSPADFRQASEIMRHHKALLNS